MQYLEDVGTSNDLEDTLEKTGREKRTRSRETTLSDLGMLVTTGNRDAARTS